MQRGLMEKGVGLDVAGIIGENLLQKEKQPGQIPLLLQAGGFHQRDGGTTSQSGEEPLFGRSGLLNRGPTGKLPSIEKIGIRLQQPLAEFDDVGIVPLLHGAHCLKP